VNALRRSLSTTVLHGDFAMKLSPLLPGIVAGMLFSGHVGAETFEPEIMTVESRIRPGANVFVLDQSWNGASQINVLSEDDLSRKGNMSVGLWSQFALTADAGTVYAASNYASRILYGPTEGVLQEFDVDTLTLKREIALLPKLVQAMPSAGLMQLSADEKYLFVQNATPASSVTVVDLAAGKMIAEVPTPGCWGVYAAAQGARFTTLCGDGTLASYTVAPDGAFSLPARSAVIFSPDDDPLFIHGVRAGKELLFVSYSGELYRVADSGEVPTLKDKYAFAKGVAGNWAPGGLSVMSYNPAHGVLFVNMHPDARDGSHKDVSTEIWAIDPAAKKLLSRSPAEHFRSILVTAGKNPLLFGVDDEESKMVRHTVAPQSGFRLTVAGSQQGLGNFAAFLRTGE